MENENFQISRRPRRYYRQEEKQKHIEEQAGSGLSAAAYCRKEGLRYGAFLKWQGTVGEPTASLRPLELVPGTSRPESVAEVRFAGGHTLLVQSGCSQSLALALTKALA